MLLAIARTLRTHWLITLLVVVGAALRVLTVVAYKPAIMFFGDSYAYIVAAERLQPPNDRPFGYSFVLRIVSYFGDLGLLVAMQHLAGLAIAVLLYVVVLRRGAPRWLAALVATPLLLDGYLLQIEHNVLSETMFASLLLGAVLVVTREHLTLGWAVAGGTLLAAAALTRTVAIPIAALFIGYLLIRRLGLKVVAGFALALAIPVLGYMAWFSTTYGSFGTTDSSGRFLYGRVAVFADCSKATLTATEASLCDNAPPAARPNANFYVWSSDSPVRGLDLSGAATDDVASSFSRKVILSQPLTYARYVGTDVGHYFMPGKYLTRVDSPLSAWQFPTSFASRSASTSLAHNDLAGNPVKPGIAEGPATFLRGYQSVVYTQGPILLLGLVLGLVAGWIDRSRRRWDGPFVALVGLSVLVIPSATVMFDYRYGLPAIPLLMLSGGIGATALLQRRAARALAAEQAGDPLAVPVRQPTPAPARPSTQAVVDRTGTHRGRAGRRHHRHDRSPAHPQPGLRELRRQPCRARHPGPAALDGTAGRRPARASRCRSSPPGPSSATRDGAVVVPDRFMDAVERNGGLTVFGPATRSESRTSYDAGLRVVTFEKGWVYWSRLGGARAVYGDIFKTWYPKGVRVKLQEPLADPYTTDDGTAYQEFAGGSIIRFADGSVVGGGQAQPPAGPDHDHHPGQRSPAVGQLRTLIRRGPHERRVRSVARSTARRGSR